LGVLSPFSLVVIIVIIIMMIMIMIMIIIIMIIIIMIMIIMIMIMIIIILMIMIIIIMIISYLDFAVFFPHQWYSGGPSYRQVSGSRVVGVVSYLKISPPKVRVLSWLIAPLRWPSIRERVDIAFIHGVIFLALSSL